MRLKGGIIDKEIGYISLDWDRINNAFISKKKKSQEIRKKSENKEKHFCKLFDLNN